jgi:hypothetical protein
MIDEYPPDDVKYKFMPLPDTPGGPEVKYTIN